MSEGILRQLATLTSIKRTRNYDKQRAERNGDPERDQRVMEAVAKVESTVDELKAELGLRPSLRVVGSGRK